jgi:Protein of unknown function (DUF2946)
MDDIVRQAMAKWPNVPAVYGWLSLSRRGEWRIKGERISNLIVSEFISRNYAHDDQGRWFFQNGPQRVYVLLDYTPMVYRFADDASRIEAHTGDPIAHFRNAYIDEAGSLLLETAVGIGIVDDRDLDIFLTLLADANGKPLTQNSLEKLSEVEPLNWLSLRLNLKQTTLDVQTIRTTDVPKRFGFNPNPRQPEGEEECS